MATAADRVFDEVVADILAGSLQPREQISERYLVARFGVSRTPVREAIKRLCERGLVVPGPKGVSVIAKIEGDDVRKLYDIRLKIEGIAAPLTVAYINPAELAQLRRINKRFRDAVKRRDLIQMLEVRAEFHAVTAQATRNRWLAGIMVMLRERAYPVRHLHWQDVNRAAQTVAVHDSMIEKLAQRDGRHYRSLVIRQIRAAIDCYNEQLRPKGKKAAIIKRLANTESAPTEVERTDRSA
ncbi:MAG TPA: GntR family transcriptional regulator [Terracidiphilus sp.]|nr:GntR family transcriptional regulator [Terracidiphilus sp.]